MARNRLSKNRPAQKSTPLIITDFAGMPPQDRIPAHMTVPVAVELTRCEWIAVYSAMTESTIFASPDRRGIEAKIEAAITGG